MTSKRIGKQDLLDWTAAQLLVKLPQSPAVSHAEVLRTINILRKFDDLQSIKAADGSLDCATFFAIVGACVALCNASLSVTPPELAQRMWELVHSADEVAS